MEHGRGDVVRAQASAEAIRDALVRWVDDGACGLDAAGAAFICARVTAAGPAGVKEARVAATYLGRYAADRVASGRAVDDSMFDPAALAAYRAGALATANPNSAAACLSYLKRLAPGVGLRTTTRGAAVGSTSPATTPTRVIPPAGDTPAVGSGDDATATMLPLLRPEVSRALEAFVPELLDAARFARIRDLVLTAVRGAHPDYPARAIALARTAAYAAAWLDEAHRPLRVDVLLAAATIEEFLAALDGKVSAGSRATYASQLHALRRAHGIDLDTARSVFGSRKRTGLYTPGEIAELYRQARRLPSATRGTHVVALLDLVFGTGAGGHDAARVGPDDVTATARGLVVVLADRRVLVTEQYAPSLAQRATAAAAAGESYLIGGNGARQGRPAALVAPAKSGKHRIDLDMLRARDTWLAATIHDPRWATPAEMLAAAGTGALVRLGRLATAGLITLAADTSSHDEPTSDEPGAPGPDRLEEAAS